MSTNPPPTLSLARVGLSPALADLVVTNDAGCSICVNSDVATLVSPVLASSKRSRIRLPNKCSTSEVAKAMVGMRQTGDPDTDLFVAAAMLGLKEAANALDPHDLDVSREPLIEAYYAAEHQGLSSELLTETIKAQSGCDIKHSAELWLLSVAMRDDSMSEAMQGCHGGRNLNDVVKIASDEGWSLMTKIVHVITHNCFFDLKLLQCESMLRALKMAQEVDVCRYSTEGQDRGAFATELIEVENGAKYLYMKPLLCLGSHEPQDVTDGVKMLARQASVRISHYVIGRGDEGSYPTDWNVWGSPDGLHWDLIDHQAGNNALASSPRATFHLGMTKPYRGVFFQVLKFRGERKMKYFDVFGIVRRYDVLKIEKRR